jgi:RND family efflux transporter MFP subunit
MRKMTRKKMVIAAAVVVVALAVWGWHSRTSSDASDASEEDSPGHAGGAVTVAVARVQRGDLEDTLALAGAFKPFQDVDVHAKIAGYIRRIYVDVGDHVKEGQILAVLEIPELTAQLPGAEASVRAAQEQIHRAQGDLQRAQSTQVAAHLAYTRLKQAADSRAGLVAQQEVDDSQAKDLESAAQVASAEAELSAAKQQLEVAQASLVQVSAMSGYTRITAPFAGVVTSRTADTGALVAAGTSESTQAIPVVRLAQTSVLRLVLPIPESIAAGIRVGQTMKVHVQALNKDFPGKVARFADSLNEQTRTMETEIDLDNRDGKVIPGMYAEVAIPLDQQHAALNIPIEAVMRANDATTVWVVNQQNKVELRHVTLGYEGSSRVVVLAGLQEGERVIVGGQSGVTAGESVETKDVTVTTPEAVTPETAPSKSSTGKSKGAH